MAATSFFAAVLRRCRSGYPDPDPAARLRLLPRFLVDSPIRALSSGPMRSEEHLEGDTTLHSPPEDDLRLRIFRLRFPKRSATAALEKWVAEGRKVTTPELRRIARELRRAQRYKHALEILTWIESHGRFSVLAPDYALKLELIAEVHGISDAEDYYQKIHGSTPLKAASLSLLRYYVKERHIEQAETLLVKLQVLGLSNRQHFNEMMKLYMVTCQYDKVLIVIRKMKHDMIPRDVLSYNIWLNACNEVSTISSVEKVYEEMMNDKNVVVGWSTYCTLANIYTKHGITAKAFTALRAAEKRLSMRNRLGFFFLITLYAALNDRDGVLRLWESSKKVVGKITCANYMCIILCLVKVDDIGEAEKVFKKWESECRKYDIRVSNVLLGAYVRRGWMDKAESLHFHTLEKGGCPNYKTWEILIEGWVKSKEMNKAVEAMKKGFSLMKFCAWRPSHEALFCIMTYFEEQGKADDAKRYVKVLRRYNLMTLLLYKSYLRACLHAQRTAPNIRKMTQMDKVDLDEEALALIQCVSNINGADI